MKADLKLLELLVDAWGYCSDDDSDLLLELIRKKVKKHLNEGNVKVKYIQARLPNAGSDKEYEKVEEFDKAYNNLIEESANAGVPEAQYQHACRLYEKQQLSEAVSLYKKSADQGYAPAQYCFGLDRFNGVGIGKDKQEGLEYIELAAGQLDEYALEFLIRLHTDNISHESEKKLKRYKKMLKWAQYY